MPGNREARLLEVKLLAATGMTQTNIAAQVGVHPRTVADDMAILRHRGSPHRNQAWTNPPVAAQSSEEHLASRTWTTPLPCEDAWASTPKVKVAGVYKWFLEGDLPTSFNWPGHLTQISPGDLIYVGRATDLRTRAKHHKLQTYSSSLRRTLASLMGFPAVWQGRSAHPRISDAHHAVLSRWMAENLQMSWSPLLRGEVLVEVEKVVRKKGKAPLNKDNETPEQRYALDVGKKWEALAVTHEEDPRSL